MASYIIPKIGQKVKASLDAWSKCYPFLTALEHNHEIGIITEIRYSGFRLEDADYKHSDTIYTVTFPATIFEEEREVYCRYDDLIMSSARVYSGADFDGDCVTGLTGVIPTCAMTRYESVQAESSGMIYTTMPASVLNDIVGNLLKDLDKANTHIKEAAEKFKRMDVPSAYPRIEPKVKTHLDVDSMLNQQLYLYSLMQESPYSLKRSAPPDVKIDITFPPRCGKSINTMLHTFYGLTPFAVKEKDPLIKTVITSKKEKNVMSTIDFRVKKIMHNGPATIVFWKDGTKTVVRLKEGDKYDPYAAFTAAVAKRLYGKTVKISEIVDRYSKDLKKIDIPETPPRELSVEELKAAAEKLGYRVSKKPKK